MKSHPKIVTYRSCRSFDEKLLLSDLHRKLVQGYLYNYFQDKYRKLTTNFKEVLDRHAFIKQKKEKGNLAPFITKDLRKPIMNNLRLKTKYSKFSQFRKNEK